MMIPNGKANHGYTRQGKATAITSLTQQCSACRAGDPAAVADDAPADVPAAAHAAYRICISI